MAAGDLTKKEDVFGTLSLVHGTIEGPASYAAGGFGPTPAKFGLTTVEFCHVQLIQSSSVLAYVGLYDHTTDKIKFYETGTVVDLPLVEIDDTTNLAAITIRFQAYGRK
jgi:hypothetical protein